MEWLGDLPRPSLLSSVAANQPVAALVQRAASTLKQLLCPGFIYPKLAPSPSGVFGRTI